MASGAAVAALREQFLHGMSCAACTVNVVTTDGPGGRAGITVSAMSSVSADGPAPTLLVCVHHESATARTIIANGCFCVNVLRDDQAFISDIFAGRRQPDDNDKFSCASWQKMLTGSPRVVDPLASFDCVIKSAERVGTHHVFIGEVQEIFSAAGGSALIYANRAYGTPARINAAPGGASSDRLKIGTLHTFGPYLLPALLKRLEDDYGPTSLSLHEGDQRRLLELLRAGDIDLAYIYDFDLGEGIDAIVLTEVQPYVLLPEGHRLADQPLVSLHDLVAEPLVLLDAPPSRDYFLQLFAGIGCPRISYSAQSFEMVRGMVGHGLGYSLLATKPASSMTYDGMALTIRPLLEKTPASRLVLTRLSHRPLNRLTEDFARRSVAFFASV